MKWYFVFSLFVRSMIARFEPMYSGKRPRVKLLPIWGVGVLEDVIDGSL